MTLHITNQIEFGFENGDGDIDTELEITNRIAFPVGKEDLEWMVEEADLTDKGLISSRPYYFPFRTPGEYREPRPDRPLGQQGKQFSLQGTLKWEDNSYRIVQDALHGISKLRFNLMFAYDKQTEAAKDGYLQEAVQMFPFLGTYSSSWPVVEFAEMYLKNVSDNYKRKLKDIANPNAVAMTGHEEAD
ncbi:hypothetical protein H1R20_g9457, partial [Candolleomyces eurysporus]